MDARGDWNYPTSFRIGMGRIKELPDAIRSLGVDRPLVVTDPFLATLPMLQDIVSDLRNAEYEVGVFSEIQPNPIDANIVGGVSQLRAGGHDSVIAIGGGSALDAGKAIAFMSGQARPLWDFEDIDEWWKLANAEAILPIIAVPTSAGTGSEVGRAAVITNEETHTKKVIFHPLMMPRIAICDPALTVGMPPIITAGTGMDAFAHCLEAYCGPFYHPMADGIAMEGMRLVRDHLPVVYADAGHIQSRTQMMAAAMMGATAFQKCLGAIHELSHPVGSHHGSHHGLTNAVFMPYVLVFNRPAIDEKIERLASYLGLPASFDSFLDWVLELRADLSVPHTLAELIDGDDSNIAVMSEMAPSDPTAAGNPIPINAEICADLYRRAWSGHI